MKQIFQIINQTNHLNLEQQINLRKMMAFADCITPIRKPKFKTELNFM